MPFQENKSFDTPFDVAVMKGHEEMVSLLLNANADQSYFNPGCMTMLYLAAQNGNSTIADALLAKTPHEKVNAINIWLSTPLHLAAEGGYLDIVKALLKASADTTARNVWCRTPLDLAWKNAHSEVRRKLSIIHAGNAVPEQNPETEPR